MANGIEGSFDGKTWVNVALRAPFFNFRYAEGATEDRSKSKRIMAVTGGTHETSLETNQANAHCQDLRL